MDLSFLLVSQLHVYSHAAKHPLSLIDIEGVKIYLTVFQHDMLKVTVPLLICVSYE